MSLPDARSAALHEGVDAVAAALHALVDVAVGVLGEYDDAGTARTDPRLADAEHRTALLLGRLDDLFVDQLDMPVDIGAMAWDGVDDTADELEVADEPAGDGRTDDFWLHFVVAAPAAASVEALDSALETVHAGGDAVARRLEDTGYLVAEFSAWRGPLDLDAGEADDGPGPLGGAGS